MLELVLVVILREDNVIKYYFITLLLRLTYYVVKLLQFSWYRSLENITVFKLNILHSLHNTLYGIGVTTSESERKQLISYRNFETLKH